MLGRGVSHCTYENTDQIGGRSKRSANDLHIGEFQVECLAYIVLAISCEGKTGEPGEPGEDGLPSISNTLSF